MNINNIFEKYGLSIIEVEHNVFRVSNSSSIINIDEFGKDLRYCTLIVSSTIRKEKDIKTNTYHKFAHVYYIITDLNSNSWRYYKQIAESSFGIVFARDYDIDKIESLGTLYDRGVN